jgi:hypothetical protein
MSVAAESLRNRVRNGGAFANGTHRDADSGEAMSGIVMHNEFSKTAIGQDGVSGLVVVTSHCECLTETANTVAAHFSATAIGIPKVHHHIDWFAIGASGIDCGTRPNDETVGTKTPATVTESASQGGVAMKRSVDLLKSNDEIVAQAVVLGESHGGFSQSAHGRVRRAHLPKLRPRRESN